MDRDRDIENELIASLLGDAPRSQAVDRWLETERGRRAQTEYRATLGALDRLAAAPRSAPAPTLRYTALDTPVGPIFVAAGPRGLVRLAFGTDERAFRAELTARLPGAAALERSPQALAETTRQLEEYFTGRRGAFALETDLGGLTPFQRRVLEAARAIPAGSFVSYGSLARRVGAPGGSRAVGQALGRNPVPIVIPCHRVLTGAGRLGGYTGGTDIKVKLLALEGVVQTHGRTTRFHFEARARSG